MKAVLYAQSKQGKLIFSNNRELEEYLLANDNKKLTVVIDRETGKRSDLQNRYYFAYLGLVAENTGNNVMDLHEYFKRYFLTPKFIKVLGKEIKIPSSTTDLNKIEWSEYLDKICALVDVPLPDPNKFLL
jgi:hypothetical protein